MSRAFVSSGKTIYFAANLQLEDLSWNDLLVRVLHTHVALCSLCAVELVFHLTCLPRLAKSLTRGYHMGKTYLLDGLYGIRIKNLVINFHI